MHPEAQALSDRFLAALDQHAPGCVSAVYIVGSAALDDFIPGKSDLDFVAVMQRAITDDEGAAVAHGLSNTLDGIFLEPGDLALGPSAMEGPRPVFTDRGFSRAVESSARNPVAWATLASHGIAVRGARVSVLTLWNDPAELIAWTKENAGAYWTRRRQGASNVLSLPGALALAPFFATWSVLGLARQHYTVRKAGIISKSEAGRYALETFAPRWRAIIEEALAIRSGGKLTMGAFERRAETLAFMEMAIGEILDA